MDQKVIRRERFGVAGKVLQIGKEHGEEPRLDAGRQRDSDLISWRTTSSGTNEENDFSDVRSSEAADSSFAISWIFDGGRPGVSKLRLSMACNCRDTFSTGRDSRLEAK